MIRPAKLIGGLAALVVVLTLGLYLSRSLSLFEGRTPEGAPLLSAVDGATGFEPRAVPQAPMLRNQSDKDLTVDFGYVAGGIPYTYALRLSFPDGADKGRASVTVRHAAREASVTSDVTRRWDAPRKAYSIALQERFDTEPAVPSLCIKAVIGPQTKGYDLSEGSICVAQRDTEGTCHAETLACGQIR